VSSRAHHEAAAAVNLALAEQLRSTGQPGWGVTVIYYAAIQKLECALSDHNEHPKRHEDRHNAGASHWPGIATPWRKLKQLTEDWRYGGLVPTSEECELGRRWAGDMAAAIKEPWPED